MSDLKTGNLASRFIIRFANTRFVRSALEREADLSKFRKRPNFREAMGLVTIAISYIIGWPFIAILGVVAGYLHKPLIVAVGGPLLYLLSHLTFILGMYLSGAGYAKAFMEWVTRVVVLKFLPEAYRPKKKQVQASCIESEH